jgi:RNA polymerase sigma factor (sigma-70 family)
MDPGGSGVEGDMTVTSGEPGPTASGPPPVETFTAFYERELAGQVRRAALLIGSVEAAHDVVHDAFVAVYRRWDTVREPGPYLGRVVLNGCRDHARRAATSRRKLPLLVERAEPGDEVLWDALADLPFNQRAAVVLRFYLRMTDREIADTLGCRPGTVGPWIHRGLRRLRKDLS